MKKILKLILSMLVVLSSVNMINAQEKSIEDLSNENQVINNSSSFEIQFENEQCLVFYGKNGIDIIGENINVHFSTNYSVEKLTSIGDINGDGYVDFASYQLADEEQIIVLDGKNGQIISSVGFTHLESDNDFGTKEVCSYIYKMEAYDNQLILVYDYFLVSLNPLDCSINYKYEEKDNIFDFEVIDGIIYYANQVGELGKIDAKTGELISLELLGNKYEIDHPWQVGQKINIQMVLWDIYYENGILYITTEDGQLIKYNVQDKTNYVIDLGIFTEEVKDQVFKGNAYSFVENKYQYKHSSPLAGEFNGYKVIDSNEKYLLIGVFLNDQERLGSYKLANYGCGYILLDKETDNYRFIDLAEKSASYGYLGNYKENEVIFSVSCNGEGAITYNIYNIEDGMTLFQKIISANCTYDSICKISKKGNNHLIEIFNGNTILLDEEAKTINYVYDNVKKELIGIGGDLIFFVRKENGVANKIICNNKKTNEVEWEYEIVSAKLNKGFEFICQADFNFDGIEDIVAIYRNYKDENTPQASNYVVIDGKGGKEILNKQIFQYKSYDEHNKPYNVYSTATELEVLNDLDKDGKAELIIDEQIVSSKTFKYKGYVNSYVDGKGTMHNIGDINKDGFEDIIFISDTAVTQYISKISGLNVSYKKGSSIKIDKKGKNQTYGQPFSDINKDGTNEFVLCDYNKEGYQIYKLYDGKSLSYMYTLHPTGVCTDEYFSNAEFDLDNDGYNEIIFDYSYFGVTYILNGKTGEPIFYATNWDYSDFAEDYLKMEYYHPEEMIQFNPYEPYRNVRFMTIFDSNNDGLKDLTYSKMIWDEELYITNPYIIINDAKTLEEIERIVLNGIDIRDNMMISTIDGCSNYVIIKSEYGDEIYLFDIDSKTVLASYKINGDDYTLIDENTIIVTGEEKLYTIDISSSFAYTQQQIAGNIISINWTANNPYDVMSIYDNGNITYRGTSGKYDLRLLEGKHVISLELTDAYGKTSTKQFDVTIDKQSSNLYWLIGVATSLLVGTIVISAYRKSYIKKQAKGGLK